MDEGGMQDEPNSFELYRASSTIPRKALDQRFKHLRDILAH